MGLDKRDHIAALCILPSIRDAWVARYGAAPTDADIDSLYHEFIPLQTEILPRYAQLVPGARDAVAALRARGLRIAFTTGYSREMLQIVMDEAKKQGIVADAAVCGTDVPAGRPAPWMALECTRLTSVFPPASCIKLGDTLVDIEEGRNAGMWSVGAAISGNMTGLSLLEWEALSEDRKTAFRTAATQAMHAAGAHAVIDSIADLPAMVDLINASMAEGGAADRIC